MCTKKHGIVSLGYYRFLLEKNAKLPNTTKNAARIRDLSLHFGSLVRSTETSLLILIEQSLNYCLAKFECI